MSNHDVQGDFIDPFCAGLTLFAFTGTTSEHHTVYAYGVGNRLISWSTNSYYRYDLAGSVTTIQYDAGTMISLARNSRYRVTGLQYTNPVTGTACVEEYAFDAAGRRSSITINETNVRRFIYSGEHVVGELDGDGTLVRRYTYGSGMDNILSMSIIAPGSTNTYYYIKGHNNSVHALVDSSGQIAERYEYDAWGNITVYDSTDTEVSESQLGNRYTFQGREISWASGLYYFRARWYDPTTGRWLSKDPIGIAGGLNQYVFCGNNPVNFTDPYGLRLRLLGSTTEQSHLLRFIQKFSYGTLGLSSRGDVSRTACSEDGDVEDMLDAVIGSEDLYTVQFVDELPEEKSWFVHGGLFDPDDWGVGGSVLITRNIRDVTYNNNKVQATYSTILAHEIFGRAYAHSQREAYTSGGLIPSPNRDVMNQRAVDRANKAFLQMPGTTLRHGYP